VKFRTRRGLSQNALARRAGVDPAYVNRIERFTQRPGTAILQSLIAELGLTRLEGDYLRVCAGYAPDALKLLSDAQAMRIIRLIDSIGPRIEHLMSLTVEDALVALSISPHEQKFIKIITEEDQRQKNERVEILTEALEEIAQGSCCATPGCTTNDPRCQVMSARAALQEYQRGNA